MQGRVYVMTSIIAVLILLIHCIALLSVNTTEQSLLGV